MMIQMAQIPKRRNRTIGQSGKCRRRQQATLPKNVPKNESNPLVHAILKHAPTTPSRKRGFAEGMEESKKKLGLGLK